MEPTAPPPHHAYATTPAAMKLPDSQSTEESPRDETLQKASIFKTLRRVLMIVELLLYVAAGFPVSVKLRFSFIIRRLNFQ